MNVTIHELHNKLLDMVGEFQKTQNSSIYFAFNDRKFVDITNNIQPNVTFVNRNSENSIAVKNLVINQHMDIYCIDESLLQLMITEFPTNEEISINKIFKKLIFPNSLVTEIQCQFDTKSLIML